ncbi:hypothetical protein AT864_02649 [Anoxybacillus sp. P3H1B]|uniref:hypothetical protein n=1 Tax=Anoxybacillus sp. P3H1B TaxID=1769293 RepID=UPI0007979B97|nr:hypothetical protein [Anoxybacillus sp. P3H1B]KXG08965.1 hypothetical protein AT864_02649 [Anoxybacillus sp. P3H1B]
MQKAKMGIRWLTVLLVILGFSVMLLPGQTKAASVQSSVEKLERDVKQLEKTIHATTLDKPYNLYNQTKKSYSQAQKEVAQLKDGSVKRHYIQRIDSAYRTIQKAAYYISAIEGGERLIVLKLRIDHALSSGDVYTVYSSYPPFMNQLKKTETLVQKVSDPTVQKKMMETFLRSAEITKQRVFFPINIMFAFDRIIEAYDQDDIEKAERLLALCEKWLSNVKDVNVKKELSYYLEDLKAPKVLDVQ